MGKRGLKGTSWRASHVLSLFNSRMPFTPRLFDSDNEATHCPRSKRLRSLATSDWLLGTMRGNTTQLAPPAYVTPPFPSLYWFIRGKPHEPRYLYHQGDIWRFTFFWTIIIYELVHVAASGYALVVQWKNWRFIWIVPLVYTAIAGVEAILAGSVVGLLYVCMIPAYKVIQG